MIELIAAAIAGLAAGAVIGGAFGLSPALIIRSADAERLDAEAAALYRQDRYASELWRGIRLIKYPDEIRKPEPSVGVIVKD